MFNPQEAKSGDQPSIFFGAPRKNNAGMGDGIAGEKMPPARVMPDRELDSPKMKDLHRRLWGFFLYEIDRQADNRREMALDMDFYDNEQWTDEDKEILRARGQVPLVYNVISTTVNWLIGTERRGRTDFKVLARRKEGGKSAELKTQLMKYIADVSGSEFAKSRAFQDSVKAGVGWLESGAQNTTDGEPVYDRSESWRNILWDSAATEHDLSDGRYQFRHKWVDLDVVKAMKKSRKRVVEMSVAEMGSSDDDLGDEFMDAVEDYYLGGHLSHRRGDLNGMVERPRVRVVEAWFTLPVVSKRMAGGEFSGEIFDPYSPGHMHQIESGLSEIVEVPTMRMHVALMTAAGFIHVSESPYRHNRFPFTPVWCYRRDKDGQPYGVIRGLRDIQQDINKRASKALHILSTNKIIMDKGAVDDLDEFAEEAARPDAILVVNEGKRLDLNVDRELAPAHLDLMARSIQMIQQASGVTDESLGRTTNATSGRAIIARQDQGALATAMIFDNYRLACKTHGEKMLSLIEQFMSEEKQFRITNSRGLPTFVTVNDGLPENDIIRTKADYIISEDQWSATNREARKQELLNALGTFPLPPEFIVGIADLVFEMMDLPFKDEIVNRIRSLNGQKDPDADPEAPPTPEEQARMAAEAEQMEIQRRAMMAEVAKAEAEAAEKGARAQKAAMEIRRLLSAMVGDNVETQRKALEAAGMLITAPQASNVADAILRTAGFAEAAAGGGSLPVDPSGAATQPAPGPSPGGGNLQLQPAM